MRNNNYNTGSAFSVSSFFLVLFIVLLSKTLFAQEDCKIGYLHGQGYTTDIQSVTATSSGQFTIVLSLKHDTCGPPACNEINHYAVQAIPGTYSNVSAVFVSVGSGNPTINLGPDIGGVPFQGFRITGLGNFGSGPGEILVTYTLTGGLQNQRTLVKAGNSSMPVDFSIAVFQSVLDCNNQSIFPYYTPPADGKSFSLIGPELTSLYETYIATGNVISNDIFNIVGSTVLIEITAIQGQLPALLALVESSGYGMTSVEVYEKIGRASCRERV